MSRCIVLRDFRQTATPVPTHEIVAHGFFKLDELPNDTTAGTRARIIEVMGRRAGERAVVIGCYGARLGAPRRPGAAHVVSLGAIAAEQVAVEAGDHVRQR